MVLTTRDYINIYENSGNTNKYTENSFLIVKLHVSKKQKTKTRNTIFFRLSIVQSQSHTDQGFWAIQLALSATAGKKKLFTLKYSLRAYH